MPGHENRRQHWGLDPLVVVRVDAHILLLCSERELTNVKGLGIKDAGQKSTICIYVIDLASVLDLELMV